MLYDRAFIRRNYETFFTMTLTVTMLGSYNTEEFDRDAKRIIELIGAAAGLDTADTEKAKKYILGDMMKIGLVTDYHALSSIEFLGEYENADTLLFEIKGRAIEKINRINIGGFMTADNRASVAVTEGMKYENFHHPYDPVMRLWEIRERARFGEINSTRTLALLRWEGIGCEKNRAAAERHLKRCLFWGDNISALLLSKLYALENENEKAENYKELYALLKNGMEEASLSENMEKGETQRKFFLIESLKREVIAKHKQTEIDLSFADYLSCEEAPFLEKLANIHHYKEQRWLDKANESQRAVQIGF